MSKKLIRIEGPSSAGMVSRYHYSSNFSIAFCTRLIGNKRYQVSRMQTCRDYAHESIRFELIYRASLQKDRDKNNNASSGSGYFPVEKKRIDLTKLRLLVFSDGTGVRSQKNGEDTASIKYDELERRVFFAKKIINFYEDIFGWTRSKITKADYFYQQNCWHIMGPKGWILNPHLLSLLTITLRTAMRHGTFDFETVYDITKYYRTLLELKNRASDRHILLPLCKFLHLMMSNHQELFEGLDEKSLYHTETTGSRIHGFHSSGGIASLCSASTGIGELNKRVKSIINLNKHDHL